MPATYVIQVANVGNSASSGSITVTDTLDPNLTLVSASGVNWSCSAAGQVVTCTTTAAVPAGGSALTTINVEVVATAPTSITNTVLVTGGGDTDSSNNSFQIVSPVGAPDLTVSKTATPAIFTQGQNGVVYTITASNGGNASSFGSITVTDTLDPNMMFVSATGSGWGCSVAGQVVTCTTNTAIPAGASAPPIAITVNIAKNGETSATNYVTIAGGGDVDLSNNAFNLASTVIAPDLVVSKALNPGALHPGQLGVVYTVTASNIGSAPSSGTITVTDTLDPNLTFVSAIGSGWACSAAGQVVTCSTTAVIPAGGSALPIAVSVNVNVSGPSPTSITNKATVAGGGETNTSNNSFQLVSAVSAPDLTVSKTATPAAFIQGQNGVNYTITASNIGSAPSAGTIIVTDTLDANLTFVGAIGTGWSCSAAGQVVTCTTSAVIAAGASAPFIDITVNVAAHGETSVTNAVSVAGGGDADPGNNSSQLVSPVGNPDLSVSKTATPATFTPGENGAVYTITAKNVGNAPTVGLITVTDTLDPNLAFVSATGTVWSCSAAGQVVTCTTTTAITAGATAPPITLTVNVSASSGPTVTNSVSVGGGGETILSNDSFQLVSDVLAPDLTVSKAVLPGAFKSGQVGAVYAVTVANIGSAPSAGLITVTDTLDPKTMFVSATGSGWSCSAAGQVVTCTTSAAIAAGTSAPPITITVNVTVSGPTSVTNKVTVAGGGEVNTSNDTFQLVSVVNAPDLTVSKTATPGTFMQGQKGVHYTITARNDGSAATSGAVTVTDTLDANLNFVSAAGPGWSCSAAGQMVTCISSAVIAAGASAPPITLTADVSANGETSVKNAVSVGGGGDANPTNNSFQLISSVGAPELSVSKTATPGTFTPGEHGVVYTITATNLGNAATVGLITITDTLDPNLTYVNATSSDWSCSAAGQVVTCTTSSAIAAGISAPPITLTVNVAANPGATVTNSVTIAGGGEVNASNKPFQLVTPVSGTGPPPSAIPAITTPVLVLTGILLIGMVVWLRRRAAYLDE